MTFIFGDRAPLPVGGRSVIFVNDGIATGYTALAAVRSLRRDKAKHVVLAAPVAAAASVESLGQEADEVIILHTPAQFRTVGSHYAVFAQTTDRQVIRLLRASALAEADRKKAALSGAPIGWV